MSLISGGNKGVVAPDSESSKMLKEPVGTGSRPVPSKYKIDTSSPNNPKTMDRGSSGALT